MRNLFEEYESLFPRSRSEALGQILNSFVALRLPGDMALIDQAPRDRTLVIIDELYPEFNPMDFFMAGFEHVLYSKREDFVSELLSSCWMTLRPGSFADNPIPFFFNGFVPESFHPVVENNFLKKFSESQEKPFLLNELEYFLNQYTGLMDIKDICLQSADEMISNALYNAPVNQTGKKLYEKTPRDVPVQLLTGLHNNLFACFSPTKVIIGCEDPFGSVDLERVLERLKEVYPKNKAGTLDTKSGGGLGLNFMTTNSSNFYMYCQQKKKTVVACGFLLQGKRKNTSANKHLHISIR
jgi:hypothetical protein